MQPLSQLERLNIEGNNGHCGNLRLASAVVGCAGRLSQYQTPSLATDPGACSEAADAEQLSLALLS